MMTIQENPNVIPIREFIASKQASLFQALKKPRFSGQLVLESPKGEKWTFYLYLGRLLYASGGTHPTRRWRRNLVSQIPEIVPELAEMLQSAAKIGNSEEFRICWEYQLLCLWVEQGRITREQVAAVIRQIMVEVFFDLTQALEITYEFQEENQLSTQLVLIDPDLVIREAWKVWQGWQEAKVADRSPNWAPVIKQPEQLQANTSAKTYQVLTKLLDGQHSLRDIAIQTKRDLIQVTSSLMPYIQARYVELVEIPDLPAPIAPPPAPKKSNKPDPNAPLIACVDDSPLICQTMEQLITNAGYRYVAVNDALRAIAILLSRKPDLIFLDLVMPNANGYEICAQLRKLSQFRNTPIVILTGNDGIIDRVRAKMVGSSDFLGKPIDDEKVLEAIERFLHGEVVSES
jgi:chemotaxis family two-component system response regulator PixG